MKAHDLSTSDDVKIIEESANTPEEQVSPLEAEHEDSAVHPSTSSKNVRSAGLRGERTLLPAGVEFIGTFFLCMLLYFLYGAVGNMFYLTVWIQALMTGVVYGAVILMFSKAYRPHLNPAISLAYALTAKISYLEMFIRIVAQLFGAILAGLFLPYFMPNVPGELSGSIYSAIANSLPDNSVYLKNFTQQHIAYKTDSIILMEILVTMVIVAVALQCASNTSQAKRNASYTYPVAMSLVYSVGAVLLFPIDGAGMNPARSLGVSFTSLCTTFEFNPFKEVWVFILCPLIAAAIVGFMYMLLQSRKFVNMKQRQGVDVTPDVVDDEEDVKDEEDSKEEKEQSPTVETLESSKMQDEISAEKVMEDEKSVDSENTLGK